MRRLSILALLLGSPNEPLGILLIGGLLFSTSISLAEVPPAFSYQGILKDTSGAPVEDDVYAIKFAIYDDSVAGSLLGETSGFVPIQTRDGLFTHVLGSTNPIPDSIARYDALWVGLRVNLEPEMTPRTRLTSVPFALKAEYADTATVSLDKTIDAGELVTGVLDTARFSAYGDLLSENKVGPAPDQVAAGNHVHTGVSFPGTMVTLEDTTTIQHDFPGYAIMKALSISPGEATDFFRITVSRKLNYSPTEVHSGFTIEGNNQILFVHQIDSNGGDGELLLQYIVSCQRFSGNQWFITTLIGGDNTMYPSPIQFRSVPLDISSGLIINITASGSGPYECSVTVGTVIVEYDVD